MPKEVLQEPFCVQEIVVDCFDDYEISPSGLLSCAGYRTIKGVNTVVVRIAMPAANLSKVIQNALEAARELPLPPIVMIAARSH